MAVFVLDKSKVPLMPCSEKRARLLLDRGRAVVHKMYPFTIRLRDLSVCEVDLQPVRVKVDPGSKFTGLAVVREKVGVKEDQTVLWLGELQHRGSAIRDSLTSRSINRKSRRSRNTRYRASRYNNRTKPKGWLAPSLMHRVHTTVSWVAKLRKLCPVSHIDQELVRFDLQRLDSPSISGEEYKQGELAGYQVREYLLEKWGRRCSYCDIQGVPLQVEHIIPRSKGGSNRISNLCLACDNCNKKKGNSSIEDFLKGKPERLLRIKTQMKKPLNDASAVNTTRWRLREELEYLGIEVTLSSGAVTKYNRSRLKVPKTHALDAACVGDVTTLRQWRVPVLKIKCTGRGRYQRTHRDSYGFPRAHLMKSKSVKGFQTGDIVMVNNIKGKYKGVYVGRVVVRSTGYFGVTTRQGVVGAGHGSCRVLHRADGYGYLT